MLIEGADANASVTGNESTVPMQLRITGLVEMPNSKTYDATGCFVGLEAWGDVSSERAIVRTRNISCLKDGKTIDMPIKGHVSFRGKNGIKGEVVMRNGKILGWAWGAGFVDGIGQGMERASQPAVGLGATAAYGAGDVLKMGIGGGASKAAQTLSDYYIKRAEQYHPVIPIGAGNEVTVVFQDGFQLKTVEEMALEQSQSTAEEGNEGRVFARQGEVMNPLQYVPFNQTLYFINGDDPAQVAWMKRQTPPTLESKIILVQGSIPEMQKALDSRVYFDQNGVLCQRLGIDQVPARVSAVPGNRFLKVEFIPAEEGRK